MTQQETIVEVMPEGSLEVLSQHEVDRLRSVGEGDQHEILRRCALAVLSVDSGMDARDNLRRYSGFDVRIVQQERGIKLALTDAPLSAFVDGEMIRGIRELLFAVVRDVAFSNTEVASAPRFDLSTSDGITNAVFHMLRNAGVFRLPADPNLVLCWGGHSVGKEEYDFSREVGYQLGLRKLNICTGCGSGAMKGPMEGARIAHAQQRISDGRYVGLSEPGIIAVDIPNPVVNQLVIMPDIEKRLEAFVRIAHAVVIFPGGVGTIEELLYLLGILMHPENNNAELPVIMAGPPSSAEYFAQIDDFIAATLGSAGQACYRIEIGDPAMVARIAAHAIREVREIRRNQRNAYYFNWRLRIDDCFQKPFRPSHESMSKLNLHRDQEAHLMASNLRRAFSGLVAGNTKEYGIQAIEAEGPFEIVGEGHVMSRLDGLLSAFVDQGRMRVPRERYHPCYRISA